MHGTSFSWSHGMSVKPSTGRARARRLFPDLGICERCHALPATDRHHVNSDTSNNQRSNIAFLCRACHMATDGRSASTPELPCANCGRLFKPLRRGRCERCSAFLRRTGQERPASAETIPHCERETHPYKRRGYALNLTREERTARADRMRAIRVAQSKAVCDEPLLAGAL